MAAAPIPEPSAMTVTGIKLLLTEAGIEDEWPQLAEAMAGSADVAGIPLSVVQARVFSVMLGDHEPGIVLGVYLTDALINNLVTVNAIAWPVAVVREIVHQLRLTFDPIEREGFNEHRDALLTLASDLNEWWGGGVGSHLERVLHAVVGEAEPLATFYVALPTPWWRRPWIWVRRAARAVSKGVVSDKHFWLR